MITVTFKKDEFNISGHADYDVHGKDIVCAAVSFLSLTIAASMMSDSYVTFTSTKSGEMVVKFNRKKVKKQYEILKLGLYKLENEYPEYISINEE